MKTLKKLIIIFTSMFMLAALLSCDDGGCVESQAGEVSPKFEWHIIHLSDVSLGCEYKIELAENLKTKYNSLNINNISGVLPNKYKFFYTSEDIKKMTDAGYDCHYGFAMTSAELKESFQYSNSDDLYLNDVFKTPEKDVKIYYGIYKLSDDMKEIQGVILTEETRTPAQFSQEKKISNTTYNTNIDNAIYEFKGHLTVTTVIETQDIDTASEKRTCYPGTITITSIVPKN
ncbi:hypothetical protein [uncultured Treponema sp.]|uniref:hypothetical protein n=1 Tax=uncultured Treponema sp. TaxID=162155 RepID=UPI002596EB9C|nr:hypothetical protein [uncultured Treponema sp.]